MSMNTIFSVVTTLIAVIVMEETPSNSSSVTIHDPYDNGNFDSCTFSCCVSGNNSAGEGPSDCMIGRECLYAVTVTFLYRRECL